MSIVCNPGFDKLKDEVQFYSVENNRIVHKEAQTVLRLLDESNHKKVRAYIRKGGVLYVRYSID